MDGMLVAVTLIVAGTALGVIWIAADAGRLLSRPSSVKARRARARRRR